MATQQDIEAMYDWVDFFHTRRLGDYADFTCALFDGDFSKTLDKAQKDKHDWVLKGINFKKGQRILDIGCGWGPMLNAIRERGGTGVGVTLSSAQERYCQSKGLNVQLQDYKKADKKKLGAFDGIVSVGAFEHFCSIEEFKEGKQDQIYQEFFDFCADLLPKGGRLFLQTMTWGKRVLDPDKLTPDAPPNSPEGILYRLTKFYPGSWLPSGLEQMQKAASHKFNFISSKNGRLDYIETLNRWGASTRNLYKPKNFFPALGKAISLVPRYITDKDFRVQVSSIRHNDQQQCFIQEIMSHERMFFEKK